MMRTWSLERAAVGLLSGCAVVVQGLVEAFQHGPCRTYDRPDGAERLNSLEEEEVHEAPTDRLNLVDIPDECPRCGAAVEETQFGDFQCGNHCGTIWLKDYCPESPNLYEPSLTDDELVAVRGLIQERYTDSSLGASATASDGGEAVSGHSPAPPASPHPNLAEWLTPAICEVLAEHKPYSPRFDRVYCTGGCPWGQSVCDDDYDWQDWREHVAADLAPHLVKALKNAPK